MIAYEGGIMTDMGPLGEMPCRTALSKAAKSNLPMPVSLSGVILGLLTMPKGTPPA